MKTISILRDRLHCSRPSVVENFTPTTWHEDRYRILECVPVYPRSIGGVRSLIEKHENCKFLVEYKWACKRSGFKHRVLTLYEHIEIQGDEINVSFDSKGGLPQVVRDLDNFIVLVPLYEEKEEVKKVIEPVEVSADSSQFDDYQLDLFGAWA